MRFTKNTFYVEKNPTIVNFPIRGIEFGDLLRPDIKVKYPKGAAYDLVANVVHEGEPKNGQYKVHILHKGMHPIEELKLISCSKERTEMQNIKNSIYVIKDFV